MMRNFGTLLVSILAFSLSPIIWAAPLEGEIKLKSGLKIKPGMVLFLSARPIAGGPPLAVKRLDQFQFPLKFSLSEQDSMLALSGAKPEPLTGEVNVVVRLSQRGDALSRTAGDLSGQVRAKFGDKKVQLLIDQVQK